MANSSRTQARSSSPRGRFGRLGPDGSPASASGRNALSGRRSSAGKPTTTARWSSKSRSRKQKTSGVEKALGMLGGLSGGKAAKKSAGASAKPAGLALLAGAAGLAFKNRDRLMQMAGRDKAADDRQGMAPDDGIAPRPLDEDRSAPSPMGTTEGLMGAPPQGVPGPDDESMR